MSSPTMRILNLMGGLTEEETAEVALYFLRYLSPDERIAVVMDAFPTDDERDELVESLGYDCDSRR